MRDVHPLRLWPGILLDLSGCAGAGQGMFQRLSVTIPSPLDAERRARGRFGMSQAGGRGTAIRTRIPGIHPAEIIAKVERERFVIGETEMPAG
jgi:hypothetical protein